MASKAKQTNNVEVMEISAQDITNLVLESRALTRVDAKLDWLKDRQKSLESQKNEIRSRLVKVMQTLSHHPWDSLKGPIKAALIGAGCKNVDGALGVYKTSFKERVLPVGENADRFRKKMEFWIGWNGQKVRNPEFKKIEPPTKASTAPTASTPTASTTPASTPTASTTPASTTPASTTPASTTPASTTPASTTPASTASTASTTPASTASPTPTKVTASATPTKVTASATPASTASTTPTRVNVNSSDSLTTLEHWQTIHTQWMNNRLHMYYVQELSGILGIGPDKLQIALNEAGKALVSRANKK